MDNAVYTRTSARFMSSWTRSTAFPGCMLTCTASACSPAASCSQFDAQQCASRRGTCRVTIRRDGRRGLAPDLVQLAIPWICQRAMQVWLGTCLRRIYLLPGLESMQPRRGLPFDEQTNGAWWPVALNRVWQPSRRQVIHHGGQGSARLAFGSRCRQLEDPPLREGSAMRLRRLRLGLFAHFEYELIIGSSKPLPSPGSITRTEHPYSSLTNRTPGHARLQRLSRCLTDRSDRD